MDVEPRNLVVMLTHGIEHELSSAGLAWTLSGAVRPISPTSNRLSL